MGEDSWAVTNEWALFTLYNTKKLSIYGKPHSNWGTSLSYNKLGLAFFIPTTSSLYYLPSKHTDSKILFCIRIQSFDSLLQSIWMIKFNILTAITHLNFCDT